jgi:hypothetical protein
MFCSDCSDKKMVDFVSILCRFCFDWGISQHALSFREDSHSFRLFCVEFCDVHRKALFLCRFVADTPISTHFLIAVLLEDLCQNKRCLFLIEL